MSPDAELLAMATIKDALAELDVDAQARVICWIAQRFDLSLKGAERPRSENTGSAGPASDDRDDDNGKPRKPANRAFDDFAEIFEVVRPSTDPERVLVAAYWTQVVQGKSPFGSQELNGALKDLGHGVGAINKAMGANISKKPSLILQVSRNGSSQQARKKYKLTEAGKQWVTARLD